MAKSSKGKVVNPIAPLFTVGSLPPADRHEELFYEEEKQAMEMQSRKMLEEIERCKIEVLKEEERALEEIRKLQGSFKLREELAQKEAMVNACVKIEKEERASHFGED